MNNLVPIPGSDTQADIPEPTPKKQSRKQRKRNAENAAHELGLTNCPPGLLTELSHLGLFLDDLGPQHTSRGMLIEAYDEAIRALKDLEVQLKEIDDIEEKTPEDKDRRILLMRVRMDYTGMKTEIAAKLLKSKPDEVKETVHTKSVQSFPANAPIPPMVVTETITVKASESA